MGGTRIFLGRESVKLEKFLNIEDAEWFRDKFIHQNEKRIVGASDEKFQCRYATS